MAAAVPSRLLGRLVRLAASPPAACRGPSMLSMYQRRSQRGQAAASSASGLSGGGAAAATHGVQAPALQPELLDDHGGLSDDNAGDEQPLLMPRKLGAEAQGASETGAFQRLPMVSPSKELLDSAVRRAQRTPYNKKLRNEAQKAKNRCGRLPGAALPACSTGLRGCVGEAAPCPLPCCVGRSTQPCHGPANRARCAAHCRRRRAARALDTLMKELCVPLGAYIKGFPPPGRLHPFERALLELTVGPGTYERVLARVEALRRSTVEVRAGGCCHAPAAGKAEPQPALLLGCRRGHSRSPARRSLVLAPLPLCRLGRPTPRAPRVLPTRRMRWRCRRRASSGCRPSSAAVATQASSWGLGWWHLA